MRDVLDELLTVWLRYKAPDASSSEGSEQSFPVKDLGTPFDRSGADFQFAAAVASFGMLLRDSEHKGNSTFASVAEFAQSGLGRDRHGYRHEFMSLVLKAQSLAPKGERSLSQAKR